MGKRKRVTQNVVKIDVGDYLLVIVQQSLKDGHQINRTVHQVPVPTPQQDPPPPAFNPSPVFEDTQGHAFPDVDDLMGEPSSSEHIHPCLPSGYTLTRTSSIVRPSTIFSCRSR